MAYHIKSPDLNALYMQYYIVNMVGVVGNDPTSMPYQDIANPSQLNSQFGARDRIRTGTPLSEAADFKSAVSTCFTTRAKTLFC